MSDVCESPRCREPVALTYLGRLLCWTHWLEGPGKEPPDGRDGGLGPRTSPDGLGRDLGRRRHTTPPVCPVQDVPILRRRKPSVATNTGWVAPRHRRGRTP